MRSLTVHAVATVVLLWSWSVNAQPRGPAWELFLDGERLRISGQYQQAIDKGLTAWSIGSPWGLLCAAKAARSLSKYEDAQGYIRSAKKHINILGTKDPEFEFAVQNFDSVLQEDQHRLKWLHDNRPVVSVVGPGRDEGGRLVIDIRVRNRSKAAWRQLFLPVSDNYFCRSATTILAGVVLTDPSTATMCAGGCRLGAVAALR